MRKLVIVLTLIAVLACNAMAETAKTELFGQWLGGSVVIEDQGVSTGRRIFLHSGTGSTDAGYGGNPDTPVSTLAAAVALATANENDIIIAMPGHAETFSGATSALSVAGVKLKGIGQGPDRPTFTFSAAAGNIPISGAGVTIENVILTASGVTTVAAGITVSGADVTIRNVEFRGVDADTDFDTCILTTNAAERLTVEQCQFNVSTTLGDYGICVVGAVDQTRIIDCEFTGFFDDACIGTITAATTNDLIKGCVFRNTDTPSLSFAYDFTPYAASTYTMVDCYDKRVGAKIDGSDEIGIGLSGLEYTLTRLNVMNDAAANLKGWTYCGSIEVISLHGVMTALTAITADATSSKFTVAEDGAGATDLCITPTDGFASDAAGTGYHLNGDANNTVMVETEAAAATFDIAEPGAKRSAVICKSYASGVIAHTAGHANQTATIRWSLRYKPVDRGSFAYKTP